MNARARTRYFDSPDWRLDDAVHLLRDDVDHIPGVLAAQRRITANASRAFPAFNSLGVLDVETAFEYMERPLKAIGLPKDAHQAVMLVMLSFGMTMVEAERERARWESAMDP
jgi:hypothetical protein